MEENALSSFDLVLTLLLLFKQSALQLQIISVFPAWSRKSLSPMKGSELKHWTNSAVCRARGLWAVPWEKPGPEQKPVSFGGVVTSLLLPGTVPKAPCATDGASPCEVAPESQFTAQHNEISQQQFCIVSSAGLWILFS